MRKLFAGGMAFLWATAFTLARDIPAVIPAPESMAVHAGAFRLTPEMQIYTDVEAAAVKTGDFLAQALRPATGYSFPVSMKSEAREAEVQNTEADSILLTTNGADARLGAEGYELTVTTNSIMLRAPTSAGLFYGVETLLQLLPPEIFSTQPVTHLDWQMPCVQVTDRPRFPWRGLMLDVSRHFYTKAEIEKLLDLMALYKFNRFHWHLTDDQGWRIEIKKYPRLTQFGAWRRGIGWGLDPQSSTAYNADGQYGGFYTQADVREVVAYAAARHITIVPEIEMPGHSLAALAAYPQFGIFDATNRTEAAHGVYNPANERTFWFLENILSEVFQLFPGPYIHIGGDEVRKSYWEDDPACQALMKREGLKNGEELQSWFIQRIAKFVRAHGKTLVGWSEIVQGGLTTNAVVMDWIGGGEQAAEAGDDAVMSPTGFCYLNYYQTTNVPVEPRAPRNHFIPLPKVYAFEPIPTNLPAAFQSHILGAQANVWTEFIASFSHVQYMLFPRLCALAEVVWSPKDSRDWDDFQRRLKVNAQRLDVLGVKYHHDPPPADSAPTGGQADAATRPAPDLAQYAKPLCGTGGDANTFPGAVAPFGMIQWSPDTEAGTRKGGYSDADTRISDFSVDHISGAGCTYGEDFALMPFLGAPPPSPPIDRTNFAASFSHAHETARPGYYSVTLDNGIKVELTATTRTGFGRFTFPAGHAATMMINAASDINGSAASVINLNPAGRKISGQSTGGYFCHVRSHGPDVRTIYFYAVFDQPFSAWSTWSNNQLTSGATNGAGTLSGAFVTFDTSPSRTVLAKVGISYVSAANAKANVEAENPVSNFSSADFDQAVSSADDAWNSRLSQIQVRGGTPAERETFYSMLYHALLGPSVVSDANGEYLGYDGHVHTTPDGRVQYGVFSGWDIYRSECQLLSLIASREAGDMAQSLLVDYQQGGAFPRWGVMTEDSGVMMGDPAAPMIADFYAYGATNFEAAVALKGLVQAATDPTVNAPRTKTNERDALADYIRLGYVPEYQTGGYGTVSMTLEYASADFALAQFARALGDETDYVLLLHRAQNWRNLYNPQTGYIQMRRQDGSWAPGFRNDKQRYNGERVYVEGTASQYTWMVPFNLKTLAAMMGGPDAAAKRLDAFFTSLNGGFTSIYAYLGNEPCFETPWEYDFFGQPCKTQGIVRRAVNELFSAGDRGYPGNDDVGEMSSWYVFAALGLYPEIPGSDVLVLGSPLFPQASLHLAGGDVTITGHQAAPDAPYVQSLTVNGRPWTKSWIRYSDISRGGALTYELGVTPNKSWGAAPSDVPPSYTDGLSQTPTPTP